MFKEATLAGVYAGRSKVAEWSQDELADLVIASKIPSGFIPLGTEIASGATAPGGHYVMGPLRESVRGALEGVGGGILGGVTGAALGRAFGGPPRVKFKYRAVAPHMSQERVLRENLEAAMRADPAVLPALLGATVGTAAGTIHGGYASRRNQREETGDYHWAGHNRGKKEEK